ncbi:YfcE family phosphodiesterase [Halobacteriales archaeon QS_1_68_17]|nr:MAG: YfcE family phosphodiesterase [Halobacteriales archaeon QS_1_68_17]
MEVAILGDTHVPSRATRIPDWVAERVRGADHVIHTGDFDSEGAYERMRELAPALTAVAGNMDPRFSLPDVTTVELGGVAFVVTHGTGSRRTYEQRVVGVVREHAGDAQSGIRVAREGPTVGVAGHTHAVVDDTVDGVRLLNPGSATGAAPADRTTMMTAEVVDGDLSVALHER